MTDSAPEPGFIQAYRLFVIIRILFWLAVGPILILISLAENPGVAAQGVVNETLIRRLSLPSVAPLLAVELLLLALLLWPQALRRLRRWFVPVTLVLGSVPLLVGYYWWPAVNPLQSPFVMFFFVTAMLVAWEYKYHAVLVCVSLLLVFEALVTPRPFLVPWTVPVGWFVLQGVMMLLAGYVTATLVSVQRAQRSALAEAYQQQAAANQRLQQYAATLEELAISRERNRLARELHDTLAHSLSAVIIQLEAVRSLWGTDPDRARDIFEQADQTARTGLAEARRALQALRASPLDDLGLVLALQELADLAAQRSGARLALQLPEHLTHHLPPGVEQGVYRIVQETLENIVRHACAHTIVVRLAETESEMRLTVDDDGLGIDEKVLQTTGERDGRLGIRGMQERAHVIGGRLEIGGLAGQGTHVQLTVPLGRQDGSGPDL